MTAPERTPEQRLADFKARYPDRVALVADLCRAQRGIPRGTQARVNLEVVTQDAERILSAVFGVEIEPVTRPVPTVSVP